MIQTFESKFDIGQKVHMGTLGMIIPIQVVGIRFGLDEKGEKKIEYDLLDKQDPKWSFSGVDEDYIERCNRYKVGTLTEQEWKYL